MPWLYRDGVIEAPVLEVVVAEQCNLSCRGCSHLSPIAGRWFADPAELLVDLKRLARAFSCHVVKLLGGEPLLHPDLAAVASSVRQAMPRAEVHLVTNGLLLGRRLLELGRFDQITVSRYPNTPLPPVAEAALAEAGRDGVRIAEIPMPVFQETFSQRLHADSIVERVYRDCKVAHDWCCFTLRGGRFYKCPQAQALPLHLGLPQLGTPNDNGVALDEGPSLDGRLHAYLSDATPLPACRACLGTSGQSFAHEMLGRRDWRRRQDRDPALMLDLGVGGAGQ